MTSSQPRVVVTGLGATTPVGGDVTTDGGGGSEAGDDDTRLRTGHEVLLAW